MARKLHIQFPGAIYHVINRGNYRRNFACRFTKTEDFVGAILEEVRASE